MTEPTQGDPGRWARMEAVFHEALDLEGDARAQYVAAACGQDDALRAEVESLLAAAGAGRGWGTAVGAAVTDVWRGERWQGRRVGAYRLEREVGRGGMGVVYLGVRADAAYEQQVAVKLVAGLAAEGLAERLRQERAILARLEHPAIARLLDGGMTEEGLPYLVMEYVAGDTITAYCTERKLALVERLRLFQEVCEAVDYAHRQLVVHRDLKPGNILVTTEGRPKLLDFGIAKLLAAAEDAEATITATHLRGMTPQYASPEQLRGEAATTATDVYSLGLVLYELLTGRRPYDVATLPAMEVARVVCETEPMRPSLAAEDRTGRALRGDLDNIVLMALRKEPSRRYGSAVQLAEDVGRYLAGEPVRARTATVGYRAGKFVRRHAVGVVAVAAIAVTLVGGVVMTTRQARVAEQRFADVRKLANALLFELHDAIANLPGSTPARELVVKRALEYLDGLVGEAGGDISLQRELATAYHKVGDVQGNPFESNLGDLPGAIASYRKALAIREQVATARPGPDTQRELADASKALGDVLEETDDMTGALEAYRRAAVMARELSAANPGDRKTGELLGSSLTRVGDLQSRLSDSAGALTTYRETVVLYRRLLEPTPTDRALRRSLALALSKVGQAQQQIGDAAAALASYRDSLAIRQALSSENPNDAAAQRSLIIIYMMLGDAAGNPDMQNVGDTAGAVEAYARGLDIAKAVAQADPKNARAQRDLMVAYNRIGNMELVLKEADAALAHFRAGRIICEALASQNPANAELRRDIALAGDYVGWALAAKNDFAGAMLEYREALKLRLAMVAQSHPSDVRPRQDLVDSYSQIGDAARKLARPLEARDSYKAALDLALTAQDPSDSQVRRRLAAAHEKLGDLDAEAAAMATGDNLRTASWRAAREHYQRSLEIMTTLQKGGGLSGTEKQALATLAAAIAKCDAALANLQALRK